MLSKIADLFMLNGVMTTAQVDMKFISAPVYEVIRVMDGMPLFVEGHLERLFSSLKLLQIEHDYTELQFISAILKLVHETGIRDNNIRLEVGYIEHDVLSWVLYWVDSYYPEKAIYDAAIKPSCKRVVSIEMSMGQMVEDVERSLKGKREVTWFGQCGGDIYTPEEVADHILSLLNNK